METDERVVLIHGFSREETMEVLKAVKSAAQEPGGIAFSMTTPVNIDWKVKDLIKEVRQEHEYMKKNPPGQEVQSK